MLSLHTLVRLKKDHPAHGITTSFTGVIIDIGEKYLVQFFDGDPVDGLVQGEYREEELICISPRGCDPQPQ